MNDCSSPGLRRLCAELRAESQRVSQTVAEILSAAEKVAKPSVSRLELYGSAALLETFYSGIDG